MKLFQKPIKPIRNGKIGSQFGKKGAGWSWNVVDNKGTWKKGKIDGVGTHTGVDFPCSIATACQAVISGKITYIDYNSHIGLFFILQSPEKINILYAHLSNVICKEGDEIKQGIIIAASGNTGNVYPRPLPTNLTLGAHLHISFRDKNGNWFDPGYND